MKRQLKIAIECGDKTCASEPGKLCGQVYTARFGTEWRCQMFGKELRDEAGGQEGALRRLPECLAAEGSRLPPEFFDVTSTFGGRVCG